MAEETDWDLLESAHSCLQFGIEEQCVEKAVENIFWLKKCLALWKTESKRNKDSGRSSRLKTASSSAPTPTSGVSFHEPDADNLMVVGLKTGQTCEESVEWSSMSMMVASILNLIERLENDRELTAAKWKEEREKVIKMRRSLDEKAAERLRILPVLVQQEHERFARDLLELKWHFSFESRQLQYIRDEVKVLSEANHEYQGNLEQSTDHLELLNLKMDKEGDKMAAIIHRQAETDLDLKKSNQELDKTTEKAHQTRVRVQGEMKQITKTHDDMLKRLNTAEDALKSVLTEQESLNKKISNIRSKISHQSGEKNTKLNQLQALKEIQEQIEKEVQSLLNQMEDQNAETKNLIEQNTMLKEKQQNVFTKLENTDFSLKAEEHKLNKDLRETRQLNEDTVCEIDEMKEQIEACQQSFEDNVNAVDRAKRDLVKIEQQLRMIRSQTDTLRSETRDITEDLRTEELKLAGIEDDLLGEVHQLKQMLQKETKSKISYQGRLQEDKADLEKMEAEHEKSEKMIKEKATKLQSKRKKSCHRAALMEASHQLKYKEEASMRSQLEESRKEMEEVETTLGGKYSSLSEEKFDLNKIVVEKRNYVAELQQKKGLLLDKVDDTSKSNRSTQKMESVTLQEIEKQEFRRNELKDLITGEKLEEESWEKELRDITKFYRDSKEKYTRYVIERERYLDQLEVDEVRSVEKNRMLAAEYEGLMEEHIGIKESSLRILEHQLELEAALKDLGQLLALQMKMSTTMTASYKHRSISGIRDLKRYNQDAKYTCERVEDIRERMDTILKQMAWFLEDCDEEQTEIIAARNIPETIDKNLFDSAEKLKTATDKSDKTKTISIPPCPMVQCRT